MESEKVVEWSHGVAEHTRVETKGGGGGGGRLDEHMASSSPCGSCNREQCKLLRWKYQA